MTAQNPPRASRPAIERNRRISLLVTGAVVVVLGLVVLLTVDGLDRFGVITVAIGLIGLVVGASRRS